MKTIMKSFISAFAFIALLSVANHSIASPKSKVVNIKTSAVCESCKARIEKALKASDGVEEAILNLNSKQVKVKYDPSKTSEEKIRETITAIGYNADDQKANEEAYKKLPGCCQKPGVCEH